MRAFRRAAMAAALLGASTSAVAEPNWLVQPIQGGSEGVRYRQGVPTLDLAMSDGVVQITPQPYDHGSLVFTVSVYNNSMRPANFGIDNANAAFNSKPVKIFSKDDLVRRAKNRAMWTQIGLGLLGGIAAGAAASQRDYYSSTWVTPRGTYRAWFDAPSAAGQFQAAAITAGTVYGIAEVQNQLDRTVAALGQSVVQQTTVDPGESYAGKIVLDKVAPRSFPAQVNLTINWNGQAYPFTFQIAKPGTPPPAFTALASKSELIDFRALRSQRQNAIDPQQTPSPDVHAAVAQVPATEPQPALTSGVRTATIQAPATEAQPVLSPATHTAAIQVPAPRTTAESTPRAVAGSGHVWCVTCR